MGVPGRGLEEAAIDAGINVEGQKKLGIHDLRHTFASYLILELASTRHG